MNDMNKQFKPRTPEEKEAKERIDELVAGAMNYTAHNIAELIEKIIAESGLVTEEERNKSDFIRGLSVAQQIAKSQIKPNKVK